MTNHNIYPSTFANDPAHAQLELFSIDDREHMHDSTEYKILDDPDLRYKYVRYTEGVIARIIDEDIDSVVFLDKSARPVSWLMKSLWPTLGFNEFDSNGSPIPVAMPDIKYINFDREQWAPVMGRSEGKEGKGITLEGLHADTVDTLTGLFAKKPIDVDEYVSADDETLFDDKKILIVDEVSASGDTLAMAHKLLERAFRNAKSIDGMHWMSPDKAYDRRSGGTKNADLPVWYSADTPYGRGVGDRDLYKSRQSPSMRQRRGAQFLSHRLPNRDVAGEQLRAEMKQLGNDVARGNMPVVFDRIRPDDEDFQEKFMAHVNQLTVNEFVTLRRQAEHEHATFAETVTHYKRDRQIFSS